MRVNPPRSKIWVLRIFNKVTENTDSAACGAPINVVPKLLAESLPFDMFIQFCGVERVQLIVRCSIPAVVAYEYLFGDAGHHRAELADLVFGIWGSEAIYHEGDRRAFGEVP